MQSVGNLIPLNPLAQLVSDKPRSGAPGPACTDVAHIGGHWASGENQHSDSGFSEASVISIICAGSEGSPPVKKAISVTGQFRLRDLPQLITHVVRWNMRPDSFRRVDSI